VKHGVAVGAMFYEFDTKGIMRLLASAGADFAIFDLEHTGWDAGSLRGMLAAGRSSGVYPIVRVNRVDPSLIGSVLDVGARGVMAPMIESKEQAQLLVASSKYPPEGRRGFGVVFSDQLKDGPAATAERTNRETAVIAQIETPAGIEAAESIVGVDGVDVVWLGQFDLTLSLGIPGEFRHPIYREAVEHLLAACRRAGKPLGQMIASAEEAVELRDRGFQLLAYADVWVFERALRRELNAVRASRNDRGA
jgi:2-keto-3-deoxy-L-rhamnonate aldolase RhmA